MNELSLVVITGLSGGGKSTASKALEDMGYYTIDNMPLPIISSFMEVLIDMGVSAPKLALVIDMRSGDKDAAFETISRLQKLHGARVIYLTADENIIIRRYKESRRKHPVSGNIAEAVAKENEMLQNIKDIADIVIDTTSMNVHELTDELNCFFHNNMKELLVTITSFGFKHGIPVDSDMMFDVRFLRNPYFVEELRDKTGVDVGVQDYVMDDPAAGEFLEKLKDMLFFLIPLYKKEGKNFLVISIGCTGGKHRSVTLAEKTAAFLQDMEGVSTQIRHRDINK